MRWGSRRVAASVMAAAALAGMTTAASAGAQASAARSAAGAAIKISARYDGRAGDLSYIATVLIAAATSQKSGFDIGVRHGACSDGARYTTEVAPLRNPGFFPGPSGRNTFTGYYGHAFAYNRQGKRVQGHERFRVTLNFSHTAVSGVVTDTFTAPSLRCHSGAVHYVAYRDGTAQAPVQTAWGSSGHYAGSSRFGERASMDAFLPLFLVSKLVLNFRAGLACSGGLQITGSEKITFTNLLLAHNGRFRLSGHHTTTTKGFRYLERWTLSIGPLRTVRWQYRVTSQRAGRTYGTCQTTNGGDVFNLRPPRGHSV